jgi:hypothetical protein
MKEKISNAGLTMTTLKALYDAGGSRALMSLLAMPPTCASKADTKAKPRVTKKLSILTSIVKHFARDAV